MLYKDLQTNKLKIKAVIENKKWLNMTVRAVVSWWPLHLNQVTDARINKPSHFTSDSDGEGNLHPSPVLIVLILCAWKCKELVCFALWWVAAGWSKAVDHIGRLNCFLWIQTCGVILNVFFLSNTSFVRWIQGYDLWKQDAQSVLVILMDSEVCLELHFFHIIATWYHT